MGTLSIGKTPEKLPSFDIILFNCRVVVIFSNRFEHCDIYQFARGYRIVQEQSYELFFSKRFQISLQHEHYRV